MVFRSIFLPKELILAPGANRHQDNGDRLDNYQQQCYFCLLICFFDLVIGPVQ